TLTLSLNVTKPTLSVFGNLSRKLCIAATAATNRSGRTSVARIDSETSTSRMIIAVRSDPGTSILGLASAAAEKKSAIARRITVGRRHHLVRRLAATDRMT